MYCYKDAAFDGLHLCFRNAEWDGALTDDINTSLKRFFNSPLRRGRLPYLCKRANSSPVHKSGDKEQVTNYRSISLLSIYAKCLESIVHSAIDVKVAPFLPNWQQGFMQLKKDIA